MFGFPLLEFIYLVLGFGFLIFVHELGHFAVAKWVNIRCPQFAIGFGQALCSWRKGIGLVRGSTEAEYERRCIDKLKADGVKPEAKGPHTGTARIDTEPVPEKHQSAYTGRQIYAVGDELGLGETEYRLNFLPLGGYVKMMGQEDMDPNAKSDHPNAYNNKPIWARACVISAGVVMNMIFGAIFLTIAFLIGVEFPAATVGAVQPGMPAATTFAQGYEDDLRYLGLREGDVITSVNGKTPEDFKDVAIAVALGSSSKTVELVVKRRGVEDELTFNLQPERQKSGEKLLSAGFEAGPGLNIGSFKGVEGEIAAWHAQRIDAFPFETRDRLSQIRIAAVNDQPIDTYTDYLLAFDKSDGQPVRVTFVDPLASSESRSFDVPAQPTLVRYADEPSNLLGLVPAGKLSFVAEDSAADEAGLQVGDVVVRIGTLNWPTDTMAIAELIAKDPAADHRIVVLRAGERIDVGSVTPNDGKFGVIIGPALDQPIVADLIDDSAAASLAGQDPFIPGTRITKLNNTPIQTWTDLQRALQVALVPLVGQTDQQVQLTLESVPPIAGAQPETAQITLGQDDYAAVMSAGWQPDHSQYFPMTRFELLQADGLGEALAIGADKTGDFVMQTYITLLRLIQGNVKLYNLRGPVGIVDTGTAVAERGIPYLLFFLGLISVNLAVINFLPIPIVDGGHMVFLAWEKITGKPPSEKVQIYSLYVGLAVIGTVFIATFYFDVMRLITRIF